MNERTRRMNEQKSPRGLFCEENRETGGQVLWTFSGVNRKADGKALCFIEFKLLVFYNFYVRVSLLDQYRKGLELRFLLVSGGFRHRSL